MAIIVVEGQLMYSSPN